MVQIKTRGEWNEEKVPTNIFGTHFYEQNIYWDTFFYEQNIYTEPTQRSHASTSSKKKSWMTMQLNEIDKRFVAKHW